MKRYSDFKRSLPSRTLVFTVGRFNPPTSAHLGIIQFTKRLAQSYSADYTVFVSEMQDSKKNPLSYTRKMHYLNLMFPDTKFASSEDGMVLPVLSNVGSKYKNVIVVVGSDRLPDVQKSIQKNQLLLNSVKVISAGERDPDNEDTLSKVRNLAVRGDFESFRQSLPVSFREIDARRMMNDIRVGTGLDEIKEQVKFDVSSIRERYFHGEVFKVGDLVESAGSQYEIIKRGTNHLLVKDTSGTVSTKWINEVTEVNNG